MDRLLENISIKNVKIVLIKKIGQYEIMNFEMSGDEKVEIKILISISKKVFDLFGHF